MARRSRVAGAAAVAVVWAVLAGLLGGGAASAQSEDPPDPAPPGLSDPLVPLPVPQPERAYAPLDRPGPPLRVSEDALERSLDCTADVTSSGQSPILLLPGTTQTPEVNFSWNYERAFAMRDRPYCTVELPNHAMSDIQTSAEYVVDALRTMSERSGEKVSIVGFSQGGMIGRWALRFWPDTRDDVRAVIGLDPSNHGTLDAYPVCTGAGCAPAFWQQQTFSNFTTALNSRAETFAGIGYTSIWSPVVDEVVTPNARPAVSSSLHTGEGRRANISTFDVCPGHVADHLQMGSFDPVGYALVVDALDHGGVADPARIDRSVCAQPFHEGVDPETFPQDLSRYLAVAGEQVLLYPHVPSEPPLREYTLR